MSSNISSDDRPVDHNSGPDELDQHSVESSPHPVSSFSLLDHCYLFNHLSQFVSLEDKCGLLIHLNRALNKAFMSNVAICTRLDTLKLQWPTIGRSNETAWLQKPASQFSKRLSYAPIVKQIIALQANSAYGSRYDWCRTDDWLVKAVTGKVLESLYLQEYVTDPPTGNASVTASIFYHLSVDPQTLEPSCDITSSLRDLALVWTSSRDYNWHGLAWRGLKACKSLTSLLIDIPRWRLHDSVPLSCVLPNTLTQLSMTGVDVCSCYVLEWTRALVNPTFLPIIETLSLDAMSLSECFSTVMSSTGTVRPLKKIKLIMNEGSQAEAVAQMKELTHLDLVLPSNLFESMQDFQDGYAKLHTLRVTFMDDDDLLDLEPFFDLLPRFNQTLQVLEFNLGCLLDGAEIKGLASLSCLTHLVVSSEAHSNLDSMEHLTSALFPGAWSMLKSLKLSDIRCDDTCLGVLLIAAPAVTKLTLNDMGVSTASVIAYVGMHCPGLKQLTIKGSSSVVASRSSSLVSLAHVQAVFAHRRLPAATAFQKLFLIDITEIFADTAFHLLCSKLKTAPCLHYFKNLQRTDLSILTLSMLPHLRAIWSQPTIAVSAMYNERSGVRTQDLVYLKYCTTDSQTLPAPFGEKQDEYSDGFILVDKLGYAARHLVFRQTPNDIDGRAAFFAKFAVDPQYAEICEKFSSWDRSYRSKRKTPTPKPEKAKKSSTDQVKRVRKEVV